MFRSFINIRYEERNKRLINRYKGEVKKMASKHKLTIEERRAKMKKGVLLRAQENLRKELARIDEKCDRKSDEWPEEPLPLERGKRLSSSEVPTCSRRAT